MSDEIYQTEEWAELCSALDCHTDATLATLAMSARNHRERHDAARDELRGNIKIHSVFYEVEFEDGTKGKVEFFPVKLEPIIYMTPDNKMVHFKGCMEWKWHYRGLGSSYMIGEQSFGAMVQFVGKQHNIKKWRRA